MDHDEEVDDDDDDDGETDDEETDDENELAELADPPVVPFVPVPRAVVKRVIHD